MVLVQRRCYAVDSAFSFISFVFGVCFRLELFQSAYTRHDGAFGLDMDMTLHLGAWISGIGGHSGVIRSLVHDGPDQTAHTYHGFAGRGVGAG